MAVTWNLVENDLANEIEIEVYPFVGRKMPHPASCLLSPGDPTTLVRLCRLLHFESPHLSAVSRHQTLAFDLEMIAVSRVWLADIAAYLGGTHRRRNSEKLSLEWSPSWNRKPEKTFPPLRTFGRRRSRRRTSEWPCPFSGKHACRRAVRSSEVSTVTVVFKRQQDSQRALPPARKPTLPGDLPSYSPPPIL